MTKTQSGFEVCRFLIHGLEVMHDEDRADIFEGLRLVFCMFCGKKHPYGGQCVCWDGSESVRASPES